MIAVVVTLRGSSTESDPEPGFFSRRRHTGWQGGPAGPCPGHQPARLRARTREAISRPTGSCLHVRFSTARPKLPGSGSAQETHTEREPALLTGQDHGSGR